MSPLLAGLHAVAVAGALLGLGFLIARALDVRNALDAVSRWGLALPASLACVAALMAIHMVLEGAVFSSRSAIPVSLGVVAVLLGAVPLWRRGAAPVSRSGRADRWAALGSVFVSAAIWCSPAFRAVPLPTPYAIDVLRHAGWTGQLLLGESTFSAPIAAPLPNDYPWLFHATLATLTRLGGLERALLGLASLQVLLVAGGVISLFALGRELTGRWTTGACTCLFGAVTGGVGFVFLREPDAVIYARTAALDYMGDLVYVRSYNGAMSYVTGPYPRDVAFALLPGFLLLLTLAVRNASLVRFAFAGGVLGLMGLAGAEAFMIAGLSGVMLVTLAPLPSPRRRVEALGTFLLATAAVYSLWFIPMLASYLRYRSRSLAVGLVALPPFAILVAWGVVTPMGVVGTLRGTRLGRSPAALVPLSLTGAAALLLLACSVGGGSGGVFETLGFAHRYWPLAYLGVALYAGVGTSWLLDALLGSRLALPVKVAGWLVSVAVAATALTSPTIASLVAPKVLEDPVLVSAVDGDERHLLNVISSSAADRCVIVAPEWLHTRIFGYTGYRFLSMPRVSRGRFLALPRKKLRRRARVTRVLLGLAATPGEWRRTARRHGVDMVVLQGVRADAVPRRLPVTRAKVRDVELLVVHVTGCGRQRRLRRTAASHAGRGRSCPDGGCSMLSLKDTRLPHTSDRPRVVPRAA